MLEVGWPSRYQKEHLLYALQIITDGPVHCNVNGSLNPLELEVVHTNSFLYPNLSCVLPEGFIPKDSQDLCKCRCDLSCSLWPLSLQITHSWKKPSFTHPHVVSNQYDFLWRIKQTVNFTVNLYNWLWFGNLPIIVIFSGLSVNFNHKHISKSQITFTFIIWKTFYISWNSVEWQVSKLCHIFHCQVIFFYIHTANCLYSFLSICFMSLQTSLFLRASRCNESQVSVDFY